MERLYKDFNGFFESKGSQILIAMGPVVVAFIAFVLLLIFRLLNLASQPRKPVVYCRDDKFAALLRESAPELEEV